MPTLPLPKRDSMRHAEIYVYVLPARYEDILKIGFSRDPLVRIHAFHPRYYDWFALDDAFLLPLQSEREARHVERILARHVEEHRSRSPAQIRRAAAGHTEWFRGALPIVRTFAQAQAAELGLSAVLPLKTWLIERLRERTSELYEWSLQLFDALPLATPQERPRLVAALRDSLDAYAYFGIDIAAQLPTEVWRWWQPENQD